MKPARSDTSPRRTFALAKDVAYGPGASVFTRNVGRAMTAARTLRFGKVSINDHGPVTLKRSIYSLDEFTDITHVMVKLPS
jgi:aminobutyraldehyde dehydrogenase